MRTIIVIALLVFALVVLDQAEGAIQRIDRDAIVDRLDRGLSGTPMAGLGRELELVGRRGGVSPYFIAAVAWESSMGARACYRNPRNVWGLGACSSRWRVPYFATWPQAISFFVRFINQRYGRATTPWHIGSSYCPECGSTWGDRTAWKMRQLFGVSAHVRYRDAT